MIVGGEAVIFYGHARYTGDVDFFYSDEDKNAKVLFDALSVFREGNIPWSRLLKLGHLKS